jgi:hypothetical protein
MSDVFFEQLTIPAPTSISCSYARQTTDIMVHFELLVVE